MPTKTKRSTTSKSKSQDTQVSDNGATEETKQRNALKAKARSKALTRLAKEHPEDFQRLLAEEAEAVGLEPKTRTVWA